MRKKYLKYIFSIMIGFMLATPFIVPAQKQWSITTIEQGNENIHIGADPNIKIDSNNHPHIMYRITINTSNHILRYARYEEDIWNIASITGNHTADHISFELDKKDTPHFCFRIVSNEFNFSLIYGTKKNNQWILKDVDTSQMPGMYNSLAINNNNYPSISHHDGLYNNLKFTFSNGSTWETITIDDEGLTGAFTSLAIDSNNIPHIAYYDKQNFDLNYMKMNLTGYQKITIDEHGNVGRGIALAIDSYDHPHIIYHDQTNQTIKYACYNGNNWTISTIGSNKAYYPNPSISLDSNDKPHIVYFDQENLNQEENDEYTLTYAYLKSNGSWNIQSVSNETLGFYTDIDLDENDIPHLVFSGDYSIKYATFSSQLTNSDSTSGFIFFVLFLSLLLVTILFQLIRKQEN